MITVKHLSKVFENAGKPVPVLKDVNCEISKGEVISIIGPSGTGKSTLLRCLNRLEEPTGGQIEIDGEDILAKKADVNKLRRKMGMVFQNFNLFPHLTILDNITLCPRTLLGEDRAHAEDRALELLQLVGLRDKAGSLPGELSGGQKQRVAIARALAANPKILLSDEATSALDPDATESILNLLKDLNRKLGITIVIITHEMAVIKTIADSVAVMENGRIAEEGSVYDVFSDPKAEITKKFINSSSPLGKIERMIADDSGFTRLRPGEKLVKLIFQKESVGEPVLTVAAQRFGVTLNIILANVEYLHGNPFGGTIGVLSGRPEDLDAAIRFLKDSHVRVEVLKDASLD